MAVSRRRLFRAAAVAGGFALPAAGQEETLGPVAAAHGVAMGEERLRALAPVLARRRAQLQTLRDFVIDDRVGPTQGVLDGGE
ncbi:MAG: hypothetical protein ACKV2U_16880 [Bryobacteraceae bacterium]